MSEDQGGPTSADLAKTGDILNILCGGTTLSSNAFLETFWPIPDKDIEWPSTFRTIQAPPILLPPGRSINDSQQEAICHMLEQSNDKRVTIIQGPPGTGKTTVIATYVLSATAAQQGGIWLVAQSNVAVRNIAEKLLNVGFENWKLLVSKDFKEDWYVLFPLIFIFSNILWVGMMPCTMACLPISSDQIFSRLLQVIFKAAKLFSVLLACYPTLC